MHHQTFLIPIVFPGRPALPEARAQRRITFVEMNFDSPALKRAISCARRAINAQYALNIEFSYPPQHTVYSGFAILSTLWRITRQISDMRAARSSATKFSSKTRNYSIQFEVIYLTEWCKWGIMKCVRRTRPAMPRPWVCKGEHKGA